MEDFLILGVAAFLAGFVDAVVGGGGLIQLPALFSVFPLASPASLIGTSKLAGVWGTSVAAFNYGRSVRLNWVLLLPAACFAFAFSFAGAVCLSYVPPHALRKGLPFILAALALYTFWKKDLGHQHSAMHSGRHELLLVVAVSALIGFYDGFFGPGTGSFFIFALVRLFAYDFLHASAAAKVLNVACNIAALLWFAWSGNVMWKLGLGMAVCGVIGSFAGSRMAIRLGSSFVRSLFLLVVSALLMKTTYDAFFR